MTDFRSMGCGVVVSSTGGLHEVQRLFDERDRRFSRFQDHSELNHVNAHPFGVTLVSEELASMLSLALDAAHATGGLVTPTAGGALVGAGYDRDFASLPLDGEAVEPVPVPSLLSLRLRGRMLLRTEPVVLDLNGVVKSKTVDDALTLVGDGWVSAGGDIATTKPIDVGLPGGDSIRLDRGGLATSSVGKRSWRRGGEAQHHLIDPSTGRPARSPEVHRFLAILTGIFVTLHGASLLLDRVVPISLSQMLVPFSSPYRPLAVGLGITAAELMAAVGLTNLFRKQLPRTLWRKAHYLTLAVWALASLHGVLAGTDRGVPWFAGVAAAAFTGVCLAVVVRLNRAGALVSG